MLVLGVLGDRMTRIARADSVADSVALAAAADPAADPAARTVAQLNQFEIVQINWLPQTTGQCRVQVEVRESQGLLQARSNFWNNLVFNTPITSQAAAVSSQPCG